MRFLIEVEDEKSFEDIVERLKDGEIEIIERYDKFEKITRQLQVMKTALDQFMKEGYSMRILKGYLRSKGIAGYTVDKVMAEVDDFFSLMGLKED